MPMEVFSLMTRYDPYLGGHHQTFIHSSYPSPTAICANVFLQGPGELASHNLLLQFPQFL